MSVSDTIAARLAADTRARGYRDPCAPYGPGDVDLDDPVERAAVALHFTCAFTPEDVDGMVARRDPVLLTGWTGPGVEPADRQLARKRADVVGRQLAPAALACPAPSTDHHQEEALRG